MKSLAASPLIFPAYIAALAYTEPNPVRRECLLAWATAAAQFFL
jgi:hypothetical protein